MSARARATGVMLIVACGGLGLISSTQTWLHVSLVEGGADPLAVTGGDAISVLAPLSLAVLALGGALSVVGLVLRYIFGALAVVIALVQAVLTGRVLATHPISSISRSVTDATGISGDRPIADLVSSTSATAWPVVALVVWIVLIAVGVYVLSTARRWGRTGHRYEASSHPAAATTGPLDAVDSWDDLSRGDDPTSGAEPR